MDKETYLGKVSANGIDHRKVTWQTQVKGAAAHRSRDLRKVTQAVVMTGADYANLGVNEGKQTGELPWGEWEQFPHIIRNKDKQYARLYVVDGTIRSTYFVDGAVVDKSVFDTFLTPSQRNAAKPNGGTITVTLDNIKVVE